MKPISSKEIRETFLKFFQDKDHLLISSSSIIPKNDPTLLYINSGMAPLKPYFLGTEKPPLPRLCNVQPCIRTIDISDVGDRHHLTQFEMLGSWSIGNYYKEKAVELAYDLLINYLKFPLNRLIVTVYNGNKEKGLEGDSESAVAWKKAGFPEDQIFSLGDDNFWGPAGETGPCGPCTEVFFDCGEEYGPAHIPGEEFDTTKRYIEIWNAGVFMQYNKKKSGEFEELPLKSVDTGSGLERMHMVMNSLDSVYDTDLLKPILDKARALFQSDSLTESDYRVLTDHMRAGTFMLSEGVLPSNEGQGYIPRRLIRKCVALAFKAGVDANKLVSLAVCTIHLLSEWYEHFSLNEKNTLKVLTREIEEFEPVVKVGLKLLDEQIEGKKGKPVDGKIAFEIVATHGVPLDIIKAHLQGQGLSIDQAAFDIEFKKHQDISRQGIKSASSKENSGPSLQENLAKVASTFDSTEFKGYKELEITTKIMGLFDSTGNEISETSSGEFYFITDKTPFYGESGGQVGDKGYGVSGGAKIEILDTQKKKETYFHLGKIVSGKVILNNDIQLRVDESKRFLTRRNHSATHLLHSALRKVLGDHVAQKGSHVDHNRLRFDFQHFEPLAKHQISKIEKLVNGWIWENIETQTKLQDYQDAVASGAVALFGEKYSDTVRVVKFNEASTELCGGTHVKNTGEIGLFLIVSEQSIAKGIRRIEALTGAKALEMYQQNNDVLKEVTSLLNTSIEKAIESVDQLKKSAKAKAKVNEAFDIKMEKILELDNQEKMIIASGNFDPKQIKSAGEKALDQNKAGMVVLFSNDGTENVRFLVLKSKKSNLKWKSNEIVKSLCGSTSGRGGGKELFAQGGGVLPGTLEDLIKETITLVS